MCIMNQLPELLIEKKPSYLSVSSCNSAYTMPNKFYLTRLINDPMPKDPQEQAAANGTVFDFKIKEYLISKYFPTMPVDNLRDSLEVTDPEQVAKALEVGTDFYRYYLSTVIRQEQMKFTALDTDDIFTFRGVPIRVKPDAYIDLGLRGYAPFDWKVQGSNSKMSPKAKFKKKYSDITPCPAHKEYRNDILMTEIDEMWAFQLCVYGWYMFKNEQGFDRNLRPFYGVIHQLTQTGTGKKQVSIYEALIDIKYQEEVAEDFVTLWSELQTGKFLNRLASNRDINMVALASEKENWF